MPSQNELAIAERATGLDVLIGRAAAMLRTATLPLIGGLGTDVDGMRAALALAESLGGAIDHAVAGGEEARAFADAGQMSTTPAEARHRADLVVLCGPSAVAWASAMDLFDDSHPLYPWRQPRHVMLIGAAVPQDGFGLASDAVSPLGDAAGAIVATAAVLRAVQAGRLAPRAVGQVPAAAIADAVGQLRAAGFGVLVYDPASLDALGIEMLQGLVKDLNEATRFSTLAVPGRLGARLATVVSAWTTGFPPRLGFGRGFPEFDAWRFDGGRLIAAGEADALVWVAPLGPGLPPAQGRPPTVALVAAGTSVDAEVVIEVGRPGIDHDATLYEPRRDGFAHVTATAPSRRPSAAAVLGRIRDAVAAGDGRC